MLVLTILLYELITFSYSGSIFPGQVPIYNTIANMAQYANYTFQFIPQTTVPSGGILQIIFPSQYQSGLGLNSIVDACNLPCNIFVNMIQIQFAQPILSNVQQNVSIYNVLNPSQSGGTGNFKLRTSRNGMTYDENLIFSVLGVAGKISQLTSAIVTADQTLGTYTAGALSKYNFAFQTHVDLPASVMIQINIPSYFGISSNPSCSLYSINQISIPGKLSCNSAGNSIQVRGFGIDIPASTQVGISVQLTNPVYSLFTDPFQIIAFRNSTTVIYAEKKNVIGFQITPGRINQVTLAPMVGTSTCSLQKTQDYTLSFLPTNQIPGGGIISLQFPATFNLVVGSSYDFVHLDEGLQDLSVTQPLTVNYTSTNIRIGSFKQLTKPVIITIQFRAINPIVQGLTQAIIIQTYTDSSLSTLIDENASDASIYIHDIPSISPNQVRLSQSTSMGVDPTNLTFSITPSVFIPKGAQIQILLPGEFSLMNFSSQNCISQLSTNIVSSRCTSFDNLISMYNPLSVQYNVGAFNQFMLQQFIRTPYYSGTYLIDIQILDESNTVILSYSNYIIITCMPIAITSQTTFLIGQEQSIVGALKYSILNLQFSTVADIQQGIMYASSYGRIELSFGTIGEWDYDLGTGYDDGASIPCTAIVGALPIVDEIITCTLKQGGTNIVPMIIISNFQQIQAGTTVWIHIPNIQNPITKQSTTNFQVQLVEYSNRIRRVLNDAGQFNLSLFPQQGAPTKQNTISLNVTQYILGGMYDLIFELSSGKDVNPNSYILIKLPGYDTKFLPKLDIILCYIDQTITPCYTYPDLDWVLLITGQQQKVYWQLNPIITIKNLKWPRFVSTQGSLNWVLIDGGAQKVELYGLQAKNQFPQPKPGNFTSAWIQAPVKGKGYVGLEFTFNFIAANLIPDDGSILLTFPTSFHLQSSFPQTWFEFPQFFPYQSDQIYYTINSNSMLVSGISEHPANTLFQIIVHQVRTPTAVNLANGWKIATMYKGNLIDEQANFDEFQFGNEFIAQYIIFQGIQAFPSNQKLQSEYTIKFSLLSELSVGGQIIITFPQNYQQLPQPPYESQCNVSGGIYSYQSCTLHGQNYIITLDQPYQSGSISVRINNITNPLAGITDSFVISTLYDGQYLDKTDTSNNLYRTVEITQPPNQLLIGSINFNPKNEGEVSTYTFSLVPSSGIIYGMQLLIMFPSQYDNLLGQNIQCTSSMMIVCAVSQKIIFISDITGYQPSSIQQLSISISGIINPNIAQDGADVGYISIATLWENTFSFIDYNIFDEQLEMLPAPGWASLINIVPSNLYSRWQNTSYVFNLTSALGVPSIQNYGAIIIQFPIQFNIPDGMIQCFPLDESFANSLNCSVSANSVSVSGNTKLINGSIAFNLAQILNPEQQVQCGNFYVKIYDGFQQKIIEKSYQNLDQWSFYYYFPGPLIQVNGDNNIVVEAGTFSQDLWFTLNYPCSLNLSFTPIQNQDNAFTFLPNIIYMNLGDLQQKFRLSASEQTQAGLYTISWKTSGDIQPPQYTPLKNVIIQVTKTGNISIQIPTLWQIPLGGTSLDQYITINQAPALGVSILFQSLTSTAYMSQKSVSIASDQNIQSYQIFSNVTEYNNQQQHGNEDVRQLKLYLQGLNMQVYRLSQSTLTIQYIPAITTIPFITDITAQQITQTKAQIAITTSEISMIYYMYALAGTQPPTIDMLMNAGPAPLSTTISVFGSLIIGSNNTGTIYINNLRAQTPYTFYSIAISRGLIKSSIKNTQFTTSNRYNASLFQLVFRQSYLNTVDRCNAVKNVAFVLSLSPSKIIDTITLQTTSRILQQSANSTMNLYLISNPTTEDFMSPSDLVKLLDKKKNDLYKLEQNLDDEYTISPIETYFKIPSFIEPPSTVNVTLSSCTIQARLDSIGHIFTVISDASSDYGQPKSVQIWWGYNAINQPIPGGYIDVTQPYQYYNHTFYNLQLNTSYNIYIVTGSAQPGYPDLPQDQYVYLVSCKTLNLEQVVKLNINYVKTLQQTIMFLILNLILLLN